MANGAGIDSLPPNFVTSGNGSNGKYSDVYWMIGGKDIWYTVNLVLGVQSPTKGDAAGQEATPEVVQHLIADKNTKFLLCKNGEGIWGYQLEGKQRIGKFYLNNGGEKMDLKEVPAIRKHAKQHCIKKEDSTAVTDPIAHLYAPRV